MREKIKKIFGPGQILNHGEKELFVIETDTGPAFVHRLGPMRKSPKKIDADGFKRSDGKTIFLHASWWKIPSGCKVDVYQLGEDTIIPVGASYPVPDVVMVKKARDFGV